MGRWICSTSHQSVADYLLRPDVDADPNLELIRFSSSKLHKQIANTCFATLQDPTFNSKFGGNDGHRSPYGYAAFYWHKYAQLSADADAAYLDLSVPIYNDKAVLKTWKD